MGQPNSLRQRVWWIDEKGRWLEFSDGYAARFPACALSRSSEKQGPHFNCLGLIKVTDLGFVIDIQWDLRHADDHALFALIDFLASPRTPRHPQGHIALKFYFGAWNSELYNSPDAAIDRILELAHYKTNTPNDGITIAGVHINDIGYSHSRIQACFQAWEKTDGSFDPKHQPDLAHILDRALIFRPDAHGERFIFKYAGQHSVATSVLGETWPDEAIGMPSHQCGSDEDYEKEVCSDYGPVMASDAPRLDHIRAPFQLDNDDPIWLNYERLLIPWRDQDGGPLLMCYSELSQDLCISFAEAALQ